ncbi:MAG: protein-L-isoaspartate(D-aspartate) O-methyltransferase [Candidatus Doudnabacteria bacterium]|nr:protein-L-isoaspartate(D-aspartate) O-methyltransferase [Candidatus Doudnabacteria bacterium]
MRELVESLKQAGVLKTPRIIFAFLANDRKKFVPAGFEADAYVDAPLPIGEGQTISQPYTVAFMMELLDPQPGQKILDIGFGSGWTAGILAHIAGEQGKVWGLEVVPEVFEFGKSNLKKLEYKNIELRNQSGWEGLPEAAPFDRIIASAAAPAIPKSLKQQLVVGGKIVIPVGTAYDCSIKHLTKTGKDSFEEESFPGFAFVPFVK